LAFEEQAPLFKHMAFACTANLLVAKYQEIELKNNFIKDYINLHSQPQGLGQRLISARKRSDAISQPDIYKLRGELLKYLIELNSRSYE
jgi:hypothetical protein